MSDDKKIDWNFKAINPVDYELTIECIVSNKMMFYIFMKSKEKISRTKNISVRGDINSISAFDIPPSYHNLLKTILKKVTRDVVETIKKDGIVTISLYMKSGQFVRDDKEWKVKIIFKGQYVNK